MTKSQFYFTLLTSVFSMMSVSSSLQAACVSGDCTALGYTKSESECSGDIIRCPFDTNKVFCYTKELTKECDTVGDIVYNDMTCAADINNLDFNRTIIGVIASTSPLFVVALNQTSVFEAQYTASSQCNNYSVGNTKYWRLPTYDELQKVYNNKNMITIVLTKLGAPAFENDEYWSSSKYNSYSYNYYQIDFSNGKALVADQVNYGKWRCIRSL